MRGTRHTEKQIIGILKEAEKGLATAELCRQHGIIEQTRYSIEDFDIGVVVGLPVVS